MYPKVFLAGIVLAFAISATLVSSGIESTVSLDRSSTDQIYGATCYQNGPLQKKYCSFWCGYSERVQSVVEAPEAGRKKVDKPCKNSTTCAYKKPEMNEDACSYGDPVPVPLPF